MIEMHTGRPPTLAPRGMVACPHALASEAGVEILKAGGSAVDAAIAASAALSVLYPHMTGLGGDAFWLIYDAKRRCVRHLDGAGCAAGSAAIEAFRARGMGEIPFRGILPRRSPSRARWRAGAKPTRRTGACRSRAIWPPLPATRAKVFR